MGVKIRGHQNQSQKVMFGKKSRFAIFPHTSPVASNTWAALRRHAPKKTIYTNLYDASQSFLRATACGRISVSHTHVCKTYHNIAHTNICISLRETKRKKKRDNMHKMYFEKSFRPLFQNRARRQRASTCSCCAPSDYLRPRGEKWEVDYNTRATLSRRAPQKTICTRLLDASQSFLRATACG